MKRFQDLQIGDIVGVLKLGGNSVLDFKLDFKEYAGIGDLWTYEISHYSEEYIQFETNNKQYFMILDGDCLIFPIIGKNFMKFIGSEKQMDNYA